MGLQGILGSLISLIGSLFFFLAALGMIRMPDTYNRMQAGTKATTLGSILFMLGAGISEPDMLVRLIILIVFVVSTNPLSSHALARALHNEYPASEFHLTTDRLSDYKANEDSAKIRNTNNIPIPADKGRQQKR